MAAKNVIRDKRNDVREMSNHDRELNNKERERVKDERELKIKEKENNYEGGLRTTGKDNICDNKEKMIEGTDVRRTHYVTQKHC